MGKRKFKIFIDFDGTITLNDVGEETFKKFLNADIVNVIVDGLLNDRITSRECWESLCNAVQSINKNELDEFIFSQQIEPTLHKFLNYCEDQKMEVFVLSDGFDYYIDKIFSRENLSHLKRYSNKLVVESGGKLIPSFPYFNEECGNSTANCKRDHILENSSEEDYTVYIGDGNSDKDPIQYVDFIFAKDDLLKFCGVNRITYFPFRNFDDVSERLNVLLSKKRLKKRHQAQLKRREAFIME